MAWNEVDWNEVARAFRADATATPAQQPPELEPKEEQVKKALKEDIVSSCRSFEAEMKVASNFPRRSSGFAVPGAPLLTHALALQGALQNLVPQLRQSELGGEGIQLHRRASKHRRRRRRTQAPRRRPKHRRRRTQAPRRRPKHRRRRTQAPRRRPKHKHRTAAKRSRGGTGGFRSSSRTKKKCKC